MRSKPPGRHSAFSSPRLYGLFGFAFLALPLAGFVQWIGMAIYFLAAETLALIGAACETGLSHTSRSTVLEIATLEGTAELTEKRLERLGTYRLSARLARFLGNSLLVVGGAFVAFGDVIQGERTLDGVMPFLPLVAVLSVVFLVAFLVNDVIVRHLVMQRANRFVYAALPALEILRWVLAPIRLPLVWLVKMLFRVTLEASGPTVREEVLESVEEGEREGSLSSAEADMIESIMDLDRSAVKDVMTPRAEMVMVQADASLEDAIETINDEGVSRVPVFNEDRDDVIGVLYARDVLSHWKTLSAGDSEKSARKVMRDDPFFVPETKRVGDLLAEMRSRQVHLAVVIDEFRGTAGLVTIEDLLEEIVGEIRDEYDDEEDENQTVATPDQIAAGTLLVEGRTAIEDVNKALDVALPVEDDFETCGGLIFHRLGSVPRVGDRVDVDDVALTVLEADERTVRRIKVEVAGDRDGREVTGA